MSQPMYRTGRKVGRTIYKQLGPEPSNDDLIVGLVDTPGLAALFVKAANLSRGDGMVSIAISVLEKLTADTEYLQGRMAELESALSDAIQLMTTGRIGTIGASQVYSPQINIERVAELRRLLR